MDKNQDYTVGHLSSFGTQSMPKQQVERLSGIGARLAERRKAAGYTQQELAEALGTTQRMISYYEGQAEPPPSLLLPLLAKLLGVSIDELLGIASPRKKARMPDNRLLRRLQQIEKMEPRQKRQIMQVLDAFIEREQLKKNQG